jgi:hypothetical protein
MHQPALRRFTAVAALWAAIGLAQPLRAFAQPPGNPAIESIRRPTISPYLNLFNSGANDTTLNYHNFVRPQQQFRSSASQIQNEVRSLQTGMQNMRNAQGTPVAARSPVARGRMSPTGHPATFGNVGGYFPIPTRR